MGQPYVGEIRMFGGSFAPVGWMKCCGQLLPISENETLFQLIGTTYGGDGEETFALPGLCSRFPMHKGTNGGTTYTIGETGGTEEVTLTTQQIPVHSHVPAASTVGNTDNPANAVWAASALAKAYNAPGVADNLNPASIQPAGGSQPHENMMPFLAINYIISLFGVYPNQ